MCPVGYHDHASSPEYVRLYQRLVRRVRRGSCANEKSQSEVKETLKYQISPQRLKWRTEDRLLHLALATWRDESSGGGARTHSGSREVHW